MYRRECNIFQGCGCCGRAKCCAFKPLPRRAVWIAGCCHTVALPCPGHGQCARMCGLEQGNARGPPFPRTVGGVIPEFVRASSGNSTSRKKAHRFFSHSIARPMELGVLYPRQIRFPARCAATHVQLSLFVRTRVDPSERHRCLPASRPDVQIQTTTFRFELLRFA
jgi:hypothetical protein